MLGCFFRQDAIVTSKIDTKYLDFRLGDSERNHRHLGAGAAQPICAAIILQVLQKYCFYTGSSVQMFSPQKK